MSKRQKMTLGEVIEFIDGDRGKNYPSQGEFFQTGHCLFLNTRNVPNSRFSFEENLFINEEKDSVLRKGKLRRGDYVLTTRGTVGNFAYYDEAVPYENLRVNSGMVILRKKSDKLEQEYLRYFLASPSFSEQVKSRVSGSAQPQLPIRDMLSMEIDLPDVKIQSRIASVLSAYDNLIENNEKRIRVLEEMAQRLYTEWFVKFNLPAEVLTKAGFSDGKVKLVDSGTNFGKIPEGWEIRSIESLLGQVKRKRKIQTGEYKNLGLFPIVDQGKGFIAGYTDDKETIYSEDLIVFGDHTRCFKYCNFPFASGADGTQLLKTNDTKRMPQILLHFTVINAGIQNYTYARHFKFLKALEVLLPDTQTAEKFESVIKPTYDQIKDLRFLNFKSIGIRDLLIPQLVTGKRKLK